MDALKELLGRQAGHGRCPNSMLHVFRDGVVCTFYDEYNSYVDLEDGVLFFGGRFADISRDPSHQTTEQRGIIPASRYRNNHR
eukprot:scaffold10783_cov133-Skeletonema_dohrnii-CCMP3373.AAC.6